MATLLPHCGRERKNARQFLANPKTAGTFSPSSACGVRHVAKIGILMVSSLAWRPICRSDDIFLCRHSWPPVLALRLKTVFLLSVVTKLASRRWIGHDSGFDLGDLQMVGSEVALHRCRGFR